MFYPQGTVCFHHCLLLKRKLLDLCPVLLRVGQEEMQESVKVHFNLRVFALHVLWHDKDKGVSKNISAPKLPFLLRGNFFKEK